MNSAQASRMVLVSGAGMATFVLIQASRSERPAEKTYKSLWAIGVLTLGLAVFADFAPEVVGPFALLVLIAMAMRNTGALGSVIGGRTAPKKKGGSGGGTAKPAGPAQPPRPSSGSQTV